MFSIHVENTMISYVRYNTAIIRSEFHKHNVASKYTRWIDEGVSRDNQKMVPSNTIKLLWRYAQLCSYIIPDNANLFKLLYPGFNTLTPHLGVIKATNFGLAWLVGDNKLCLRPYERIVLSLLWSYTLRERPDIFGLSIEKEIGLPPSVHHQKQSGRKQGKKAA